MFGEDLQKFSGSRVMRTFTAGRVPIRNLPIKRVLKHSVAILRVFFDIK